MAVQQIPFRAMSQRAQVAALRPIAFQASCAFGVHPVALRCINHGFNTTYAVIDRTGAKYALRLNTHSLRDIRGLQAEQQWIDALNDVAEITVPTVIYTAAGLSFVEIPFVPMQKTLTATMTRWLPGRIVGSRPSRQQVFQMGVLTARLHQQSVTWQLTGDAQFPLVNQLLMNSHDNLSSASSDVIPDAVRLLLDNVRSLVDAVYVRLNAQTKVQPIHADLHTYNMIWHNQTLAVFDFDDAGLGLPVQDIAISLYYLRDIAYADAQFWAGYHSILPGFGIAQADFEALLMGRGIVLLNDLLGLTTPADYAFVPEFVRRVQLRLQHFVDTGTFALLK